MPLFQPFHRAGNEEKAVQIVVHGASALLAAVMLAPFLQLAAVSLGTPEEWWSGRLRPQVIRKLDPRRLYRRYLAYRYDHFAGWYFNDWYRLNWTKGIDELPENPLPAGNWHAQAVDAAACLRGPMPWAFLDVRFTSWAWYIGGIAPTGYSGLSDERWRSHLKRAYRTIEAVNAKFGSEFPSFMYVSIPGTPIPDGRGEWQLDDAWVKEYVEFLKQKMETGFMTVKGGDISWRRWLKTLPELRDAAPAAVAARLGLSTSDWYDVTLPARAPAHPGARALWIRFVREAANTYLFETDGAVSTADGLVSAAEYAAWDARVRALPPDQIRLRSAETVWRRFLEDTYGSLEKLNAAHGTAHASFASVPWPQPALDRAEYLAHPISYAFRSSFQSYDLAWTLIQRATPAVWNTVKFSALFCLLAVAVNVGAAWTLSRVPLGTVQLFLAYVLALAAFPLEAMAIPNFLLLRNLDLLNSIWALVLPAAVNGYWIYLLKNAFDGIPRERFEQAAIEGAGEADLFFKIGLPEARPMIAVTALYAFLWSYANFMWALIVCQRQAEWTLPVALFSLNSLNPPPALVAAAVLITSVPPALLLIFTHRTLHRALTIPRS